VNNIEFVSGYTGVLPPEEIHRGSHSAPIHDAQDWSHDFGRLAHGYLSQEPLSPSELKNFEHYDNWHHDRSGNSRNRAFTNEAVTDRYRAFREVNFHYLNAPMLGMWRPLTGETWRSPQQRDEMIRYARDNVAREGLLCYTLRDAYAKQMGGTDALFDDKGLELHNSLNGAMQEFDAAIVLLGVVRKHSNWTVVPAPLQFERSKAAERNADFLVIDTEAKQTIGVQIKSSVNQKVRQRYDPDRIVLVDGNVDFDNVKAVRTDRFRSDQKVVSWAGILSAYHASTVPIKNRKLSPEERTDILGIRHLAKKVVADTVVRNYPDIVDRIDRRISAKLE
jgi:hypothetical protein